MTVKSKNIFTGLFVLGFFLPGALLMIMPKEDVSLTEKRKLADFPGVPRHKSQWATYPSDLSDFVDDHFPARQALISLEAQIRYVLFHPKIYPQVLIGKDGWMFPNYESGNPQAVSSTGYQNWKVYFQRRAGFFRQRGIRTIFVAAPRKGEVYGEYMPDWVDAPRKPDFSDPYLDRLGAETNIPIVNLKPIIFQNKNIGRLYHRTDTHWNDLGAWLAYREMIQRLSAWFPALHPHPLEDFNVVEKEMHGGDEAGTIALPKTYPESRIMLVPKFQRQAHRIDFRNLKDGRVAGEHLFVTEIANSHLPTVMVFHDSFFTAVAPFFSEHFRRAVYVWSYSFNDVLIEKEKPDLVVFEMVGGLPDEPSSIAGDASTDSMKDLVPLSAEEQAVFDRQEKKL